MPHASQRLDLLVVAATPEQRVDAPAVRALFDEWCLDEHGRTPNNMTIVEGGCARVWLDEPGRTILYANQSGGFRVFCPFCRANISSAFGVAHLAWKREGLRQFVCSHCTRSVQLEDAELKPPGAFSAWAIVFSDVETADLTVSAKRALRRSIGEYRVVLRRP